jgi:hypothetical protein
MVEPGSVNTALRALRMASKLDPYRPSARMMLEPWLVDKALVRLGTGASRSMSRPPLFVRPELRATFDGQLGGT